MSLDVCTDCSQVFLDIYVVKGNTKYTATEEDEYYIIIHNSFDKIEFFYDLTLNVDRFEYESPSNDVNSTIRDHCAVSSGETYSVDIPYGTGSQQALVVTTIPEDVDWAENVAVKTSCSRRHWAYVVVVLVPLFVAAVGIAILVLVIWCCCCVDSDQTETNEAVDNLDRVDNTDNIDTVAVECTDFDNNIDKIDT